MSPDTTNQTSKKITIRQSLGKFRQKRNNLSRLGKGILMLKTLYVSAWHLGVQRFWIRYDGAVTKLISDELGMRTGWSRKLDWSLILIKSMVSVHTLLFNGVFRSAVQTVRCYFVSTFTSVSAFYEAGFSVTHWLCRCWNHTRSSFCSPTLTFWSSALSLIISLKSWDIMESLALPDPLCHNNSTKTLANVGSSVFAHYYVSMRSAPG